MRCLAQESTVAPPGNRCEICNAYGAKRLGSHFPAPSALSTNLGAIQADGKR